MRADIDTTQEMVNTNYCPKYAVHYTYCCINIHVMSVPTNLLYKTCSYAHFSISGRLPCHNAKSMVCGGVLLLKYTSVLRMHG